MTSPAIPIILIGGGGHGAVLLDALLQSRECEVLGVLDPKLPKGGRFSGIPVLGDDSLLPSLFPPGAVKLVNGLGSISDTTARRQLFLRLAAAGYGFLSVKHPQAIVSASAHISEGVQIMAGVVVQTGVRLGRNAIVNTGAIVDHDCDIGEHVHLAPGVTLSGNVRIGDGVHVGTAATIIQGIEIGPGATVAAGAVVVADVAAGETVLGVPARSRRR